MASNVPSSMDRDETFIEVIDKRKILLKKESMGSEKQISVDPISLRESPYQQGMVMHPPTKCTTIDAMIPLAPWRRTKLVSQCLSNSVPSSPKDIPKVPKKRSKKHFHSVSSAIHRQDSITVANLDRLSQIHLQRSKSCGEGRSSVPPEDFDLSVCVQNKQNDDQYANHHFSNYRKADEKVEHGTDTIDEKFKCKALCLHLPAFGKVKTIRARRQWSDVSHAKERETGHRVSTRVSLEMFECDSLDSASFIDDDNDEDTSNLFFDLPLELIKCSINDTDSPVTTGFVFDKEPKGVLKNSTKMSSVESKSTDSSVKHVKFTSSCPTSPTSCVTPSMRNAKDDFTAFIESQSA